MATTTLNYGSSTAITITLTSLGVAGYRESAAVDNGSNLFLDAMVGGSIQVGAVTADGNIRIFAYASVDDGTRYSGGLAGTDETIVWGTTPSTSSINGFMNLMPLGVIAVDTTDDNNDIEFGPFSVAQAFGFMPEDWGIVVLNDTDIAFNATGTNNAINYKGLKLSNA